MENETQMNPSPSPAPANPSGKNSNLLPIAILIGAVLISGSVVFASMRGTQPEGTKKYPKNAFTACLDEGKYADLIQEDEQDAQRAGVRGTPATFINGTYINGAQPWNVFKAAIEEALARGTSTRAAAAGEPNAPPAGERDVILGDPNAPVTVIEYGDYQCPFCARFFTDVEPFIRDEYIKTGKVKMVFRNYAFLGPESVDAAEAAECAKDQGKFWEFHDALYEAEAEDGREHNGNLNKDLFVEISEKLGLTKKK